jgi:hypothetical protein
MNLKIGDSETPKSRITAITDKWRLLKVRNAGLRKSLNSWSLCRESNP